MNLEADMFAKYVRRYVDAYLGVPPSTAMPAPKRGLSDLLRELSEGR